eukprot:scaffold1637_cov410-Prasinococcus_capsulatus_cf.AAC.20
MTGSRRSSACCCYSWDLLRGSQRPCTAANRTLCRSLPPPASIKYRCRLRRSDPRPLRGARNETAACAAAVPPPPPAQAARGRARSARGMPSASASPPPASDAVNPAAPCAATARAYLLRGPASAGGCYQGPDSHRRGAALEQRRSKVGRGGQAADRARIRRGEPLHVCAVYPLHENKALTLIENDPITLRLE